MHVTEEGDKIFLHMCAQWGAEDCEDIDITPEKLEEIKIKFKIDSISHSICKACEKVLEQEE